MTLRRTGERAPFHSVLVVSYETVVRLLFSLPRFSLLDRCKAGFLRMRGASVGKRCTFYPGVWIAPGSNLKVGSDVDFALDVIVTTSGGVEIGDRTLIGYRSMIFSANHAVPVGRDRIFDAGHDHARVRIGSDVWIGAGCIILPGVTIGEGAVIAAGAVVTKEIPPFSFAAGVPARVIKTRTPLEATIETGN